MKPAQGWINFLTGVFLVIVGLALLTPYFNQPQWGLAFLGAGGATLGLGGIGADVARQLRTNNELTARATGALTREPPQQVLDEAKTAAEAKPGGQA